MKIKRNSNEGNPKRLYKDLEVSGRNVYGTVLVGIPAPGLVFPVEQLENFDTFNVDQTSANTDEIQLPIGQPIGTVITLYADGIVRITGVSGEGEGINGGTDVQEIPTVAGAKYVLEKVSATNWIATEYLTAGTVGAPIPG